LLDARPADGSVRVLASSGAGLAVLELSFGGGVDLLRTQELDGLHGDRARCRDAQARGCGGLVVGKLADRVDVVIAEGVVEADEVATEAGGERLYRLLATRSAFLEQTLKPFE
jgi:hypothetical protein